MHELSIAGAILAVAEDHAGDRRLVAVEVQVGRLRQVVPSALAFAFELLAPGVALEISEVPAEVRCRRCATTTVADGFPLACGTCAGLDVDVVRGEELLVLAVEIETEDKPLATSGKAER